MADFQLVDLSQESEPGPRSAVRGEGQGVTVGRIDTTELAAQLEALRQDLAAHVQDSETGLKLAEIKIKFTLTAEGKVAFVAKGAAEASIEVSFRAGR